MVELEEQEVVATIWKLLAHVESIVAGLGFAFEGFTSVPTAHMGAGGRTQSQGNASHTDGVGKGRNRE
jgi:hypothetical protein